LAGRFDLGAFWPLVGGDMTKKIAILGFGIEGQDLCRHWLGKAKITVFDQKTSQELGDAGEEFKNQVEFKLGPDYLQDGLATFDIIFRSPAFKLTTSALAAARQKGVAISSATKLFFDLCPAKIIGVTGTKGKGTTATLITQILQQAGKKVFLAGNIGQPVLSLLPQLTQDSWAVLELSSFQLQDLTKSPQIAVVLFISSEHLDYHADTQEYVEAKTNIVRHQQADDWAVLNGQDVTARSFAQLTPARVLYFDCVKNKQFFWRQQLVGPVSQLKLKGKHNWANVCAAINAAGLAGADLASIKKAVFAFAGLEHRLEKVAEINGVEYYNDSFSTTPETAIAAIQSFQKPLILIAGGSEKGSDFTALGQAIASGPVKTLILMGQMADRIKVAALKAGFSGQIIRQPKSMAAAVDMARQQAQPGTVVLLSPACASFGMFTNYKDRGQQFKQHVSTLPKN